MTPGFYPGMAEEDYRMAEGANASLLKAGAKSWRKAHYALIAKRKPSTAAQSLGSLCHQAILEPERISKWVSKPEGMSFVTKEGKQWREDQAGKIIVTGDDMEDIKGMKDAVYANPDALALLSLPGNPECSGFAVDPETGLLLKARFDFLPDQPFVIDVKTTEDASLHSWQRDCAKWGYHLQAAFYSDVRQLITGEETKGFYFIVVEKSAPYEVQVYHMGEASIEKGRRDYKRLLAEYKTCKETNIWPGYFQGTRLFDLPKWALTDTPDQDELTYQLKD